MSFFIYFLKIDFKNAGVKGAASPRGLLPGASHRPDVGARFHTLFTRRLACGPSGSFRGPWRPRSTCTHYGVYARPVGVIALELTRCARAYVCVCAAIPLCTVKYLIFFFSIFTVLRLAIFRVHGGRGRGNGRKRDGPSTTRTERRSARE